MGAVRSRSAQRENKLSSLIIFKNIFNMKAKISSDLLGRIKCAKENGSIIATELLEAIKASRDMSEETDKTITDLRFDSDCRTIRSYIRSSADPSFEKMTRSTNDWGYPIFFYEKDMDMLRLMYEDIENELRDEPKLKSALPF